MAGAVIARSTHRMDATTLNFYSLVPGAVMMLLIGVAAGDAGSLSSLGVVGLAYLAAAGVTEYFLGRVFYFVSLREVGLARTTPLTNLSVLLAPVAAVFLVREAVTPKLAVGLGLVFVGVFLLTRRPGSQ